LNLDLQTAAERRGRRAGLLAIGVLLFGMSGGVAGRAQEVGGESRLDRAFFCRFGRDFTEVITAPARWDRGDLLTLAAVSGSGLLLMAFDQEVQDWAQGRRTASSDKATSFITHFGDGAVLLGLSAAVYAAGEIGHDDGLRKTALLSLESLATASLLVWTTKVIVGRARPYTEESSGSFHPFALKSSLWSFPSGHAAAAFSVATTIALQSRSVFVDIVAYSLASLAGLSRIHDNSHWASDVFIGSAVGYFVAKKITDLNRTGEKRTVSLGFQCSGGRQSLTLSIAF
jgi:membrane-associated phospholipid phosphatase